MMTIGLTGRSGCGKSSVSGFFRAQGCACIDADQVSREVLQPGSPCLLPLKNTFGFDIVDKNGVLNRRLLANRAFATPEGTRKLTEITHPEILSRIRAAARQAQTEGCALFFVDGAVILGTPFENECDRLVVVTAPYEQSIARICARDGISAEMARRRLDAQMPEEELCAAADYLIHNDGSLADLELQCRRVLDSLRKEAHETSTTDLSERR